MSAAIFSQDILAICVFLADGDIHLSLEEVIRRAETYQEVQNRHFGISRSDFRGLMLMLISYELGVKRFNDEIYDIKLSDIINEILKYHEAYYNDEGEHWIKDYDRLYEGIDCQFVKYWFDYNEEEYREKIRLKEGMKRFFANQQLATLDPKSVKKFMEEMKITVDILYHCSRPGESS